MSITLMPVISLWTFIKQKNPHNILRAQILRNFGRAWLFLRYINLYLSSIAYSLEVMLIKTVVVTHHF